MNRDHCSCSACTTIGDGYSGRYPMSTSIAEKTLRKENHLTRAARVRWSICCKGLATTASSSYSVWISTTPGYVISPRRPWNIQRMWTRLVSEQRKTQWRWSKQRYVRPKGPPCSTSWHFVAWASSPIIHAEFNKEARKEEHMQAVWMHVPIPEWTEYLFTILLRTWPTCLLGWVIALDTKVRGELTWNYH